jgi:hypothetical protein
MKLTNILTEQANPELLSALEDTVDYCVNVQKGELPTRDAIQFLAGRCKHDNVEVSKLLDKLLRNTIK